MHGRLFLIDSGSSEDSLLAWMLREKGYEVSLSSSPGHDLETWQSCPPDVMLLNVVQPIAEAQHKILLYREAMRTPIVAMLTPDVVLSLRSDSVLTADHFIFKPFRLEQLQAILQLEKLNRGAAQGAGPNARQWPALERRKADRRNERRHGQQAAGNRHQDSAFKVDTELQDVFINGTPLNLSRKEYALFRLLAGEPGALYTDDQIIQRLWPNCSWVTETEVRQYIYRLRKRIERNPDLKVCIETIRGRGYRLIESFCPRVGAVRPSRLTQAGGPVPASLKSTLTPAWPGSARFPPRTPGVIPLPSRPLSCPPDEPPFSSESTPN